MTPPLAMRLPDLAVASIGWRPIHAAAKYAFGPAPSPDAFIRRRYTGRGDLIACFGTNPCSGSEVSPMARACRRARLALARKEVIRVPTEMLTRDEHRVLEEPPGAARPTRPDELHLASRRYAVRMRRLKLSLAVWGVWTILITPLWLATG